MASIQKITLSDGTTTWIVRWKTPERQSRKKAFDRKPHAIRFKTPVEHSVLSGTYVDPKDGRITVREYGDAWIETQMWRPSTLVRVEGVLNNYVVPALGDRPLSSVRTTEVQAFVKDLTVTLAPSTVGAIHGVLVALYRAAIRDRLVPSSPCVGIKLPAEHKRLVIPLTFDQVQAVCDTIGEKYQPLVVLGAAGRVAGW
jgi:hypothetical protein